MGKVALRYKGTRRASCVILRAHLQAITMCNLVPGLYQMRTARWCRLRVALLPVLGTPDACTPRLLDCLATDIYINSTASIAVGTWSWMDQAKDLGGGGGKAVFASLKLSARHLCWETEVFRIPTPYLPHIVSMKRCSHTNRLGQTTRRFICRRGRSRCQPHLLFKLKL